MIFARILLFIHGIMVVTYGCMLLYNPASLADYMGLIIANEDGFAELISTYFGMNATVGIFMLFASFTNRYVSQAIMFLAITILGVALGRTIGFFMYETGAYTFNALIYDIPMSLLSWFACYRLQKNKPS